jgi:two-component system OmpR family response regulator
MTSGGQSAGTLLVVDDEDAITELLSTALRFEGFEVDVEKTGYGALRAAVARRYDLLLLDVMLPDLEGVEVCRKLRESGENVPVIFLTARDATEDKVAGLKVGGDDYVTKPFSIAELVARISATLRRAGRQLPDTERLVFEDLVMDLDTFEVWRDGKPIELTATEFHLLRYLMENARHVLSKSQILDAVWGHTSDDPNVVETYISYLRKKVDRFDPPLIHTVRGLGYTLRLRGSR